MTDTVIGHTLFGSGPTKVVALHDWFGDSSIFDPILQSLDGGALSIAFMDNRGYGKSRNCCPARALDGTYLPHAAYP